MRTIEAPGPGAYNDDVGMTRYKQSAAKIGSGQRQSEFLGMNKSAYTPGPGNYDNKEGDIGAGAGGSVRYKAPSFTIAGKGKNNADTGIPGPGQY